MRRADLLPDRYTYNALLRGIAAARDFEDTQRVVRPTTSHVLTGAPFLIPFLVDLLVHFVYQRGSGSLTATGAAASQAVPGPPNLALDSICHQGGPFDAGVVRAVPGHGGRRPSA